MWILAWWQNGDVIVDPEDRDIIDVMNCLDNASRHGLTLFYERRPSAQAKDARIIVMGGDRVNVTFTPADTDQATHILIDPDASLQDSVAINMGDMGIFEFPASETVPRETALTALLYFFETQSLGGHDCIWALLD